VVQNIQLKYNDYIGVNYFSRFCLSEFNVEVKKLGGGKDAEFSRSWQVKMRFKNVFFLSVFNVVRSSRR
jgi:hypothetical protein